MFCVKRKGEKLMERLCCPICESNLCMCGVGELDFVGMARSLVVQYDLAPNWREFAEQVAQWLRCVEYLERMFVEDGMS